jgi:hypothetical protein
MMTRRSLGQLLIAFQVLLEDIQGKEQQSYGYKTRFVVRESTSPPRR